MRFNLKIRFTAFALAISFSTQQILWANPEISVSTRISYPNEAGIAHPLLGLELPDEMGSVKERFSPQTPTTKDQPFVIHIQDAHSHPEAQRNIESILAYLSSKKLTDKIMVEGAVGEVDPKVLNRFSDHKMNLAVADKLIEMGELTGAEFYGLKQNKKKSNIYGIEDFTLYAKSFLNFRTLKSHKKEIEKTLSIYRKHLEELEIVGLNKDLGRFLRSKRNWQEKGDETISYFETLSDLSKTYLSIDLNNSIHQFDWPYLSRIIKINEKSKSLNHQLAKLELAKLKKEISQLKSGKNKELLLNGLSILSIDASNSIPNVKVIRHFFELLYDESKREGIVLLNYPNFLKWAGILILQDEIDATSLFNEADVLGKQLEEKLIKETREKEILSLSHDFSLLEQLLDLKLSRDNFREYQKRKQELNPTIFQKRFTSISPKKYQYPLIPENWIHLADQFYALSVKRDQKLFDNTLKQANSANSKATVLITGGFHTDGLTQLMKEKQIPHLVISPKMTEFGNEDLYERVMTGANVSKETLGRVLTALQEPRFRSHLGISESEILNILNTASAKIEGTSFKNQVSVIADTRNLITDTRIKRSEALRQAQGKREGEGLSPSTSLRMVSKSNHKLPEATRRRSEARAEYEAAGYILYLRKLSHAQLVLEAKQKIEDKDIQDQLRSQNPKMVEDGFDLIRRYESSSNIPEAFLFDRDILSLKKLLLAAWHIEQSRSEARSTGSGLDEIDGRRSESFDVAQDGELVEPQAPARRRSEARTNEETAREIVIDLNRQKLSFKVVKGHFDGKDQGYASEIIRSILKKYPDSENLGPEIVKQFPRSEVRQAADRIDETSVLAGSQRAEARPEVLIPEIVGQLSRLGITRRIAEQFFTNPASITDLKTLEVINGVLDDHPGSRDFDSQILQAFPDSEPWDQAIGLKAIKRNESRAEARNVSGQGFEKLKAAELISSLTQGLPSFIDSLYVRDLARGRLESLTAEETDRLIDSFRTSDQPRSYSSGEIKSALITLAEHGDRYSLKQLLAERAEFTLSSDGKSYPLLDWTNTAIAHLSKRLGVETNRSEARTSEETVREVASELKRQKLSLKVVRGHFDGIDQGYASDVIRPILKQYPGSENLGPEIVEQFSRSEARTMTLDRRRTKSIIIGDHTKITVINIEKDRVELQVGPIDQSENNPKQYYPLHKYISVAGIPLMITKSARDKRSVAFKIYAANSIPANREEKYYDLIKNGGNIYKITERFNQERRERQSGENLHPTNRSEVRMLVLSRKLNEAIFIDNKKVVVSEFYRGYKKKWWIELEIDRQKVNRRLFKGSFIRIGESTVEILRFKGDQVRLGIEAPDHVKIYREEVFPGFQSSTSETRSEARTTREKVIAVLGAYSNLDDPLLAGVAIKFLRAQTRFEKSGELDTALEALSDAQHALTGILYPEDLQRARKIVQDYIDSERKDSARWEARQLPQNRFDLSIRTEGNYQILTIGTQSFRFPISDLQHVLHPKETKFSLEYLEESRWIPVESLEMNFKAYIASIYNITSQVLGNFESPDQILRTLVEYLSDEDRIHIVDGFANHVNIQLSSGEMRMTAYGSSRLPNQLGTFGKEEQVTDEFAKKIYTTLAFLPAVMERETREQALRIYQTKDFAESIQRLGNEIIHRSELRTESQTKENVDFNYDFENKKLIVTVPIKLAINLGAYRVRDGRNVSPKDLRSNFDESQKVVANTVSNRVFDAFIRELIGEPNLALTDIYGVENINRFFMALKGNEFHGRFPSDELELKKDNTLIVNGHSIRLHSEPPTARLLKEFKTEYLIDFSDMDLTGETEAFRQSRLENLFPQSKLKKIFSFFPDEDAKLSTPIVAGVNTENLTPGEKYYFSLASPLTLATAHILNVVETHFGDEFEYFGGIQSARPLTGDAGGMNFINAPFGQALKKIFPNLAPKTTGTLAEMIEYESPKGSQRVRILLNPKPDSKLKQIAGQEKKVRQEAARKIREEINQIFNQAANGALKDYLGFSTENLNSLTTMRDPHPVVFDSQQTAVLESGQVELFFWFNDMGYVSALNRLIKSMIRKDGTTATAGEIEGFESNVEAEWPKGAIRPNVITKEKKWTQNGDEVGFIIVGVRGRIGKLIHQLLTSNPNYTPKAWLGVRDIDTLIQQFKEDAVHGPIDISREGEFYEIEKSEAGKEVLLRSKKTGLFLTDPKDPELPLRIPYFHIQKRQEESQDAFERRLRQELGPILDETETIINAAGFALDKNDPYYNAFRDQKNLRRVILTSPAKGQVDLTVIRGINEDRLIDVIQDHEDNGPVFISCASCTTTALTRPLLELVTFLEPWGVEYTRFITEHSITTSQVAGDVYGPSEAGKSLRTASSALMSSVPESTGANKAIIDVRVELKGKLSGISSRNANLDGSIVIANLLIPKSNRPFPTAKEINQHFEGLSNGPLQGIITYDAEVGSTKQITGQKKASIFIPWMTKVEVGKTSALVTIAIGYDNEDDYATAVAHIEEIAALKTRGLLTPESLNVASVPLIKSDTKSRSEARQYYNVSDWKELRKIIRDKVEQQRPRNPLDVRFYERSDWHDALLIGMLKEVETSHFDNVTNGEVDEILDEMELALNDPLFGADIEIREGDVIVVLNPENAKKSTRSEARHADQRGTLRSTLPTAARAEARTLILTRQIGESIFVGDTKVTVLDLNPENSKRNIARLMIDDQEIPRDFYYNDRLYLSDDVSILIGRFQNKKVSIGTDAPEHVRIRREELAPKTVEMNRFSPPIPISVENVDRSNLQNTISSLLKSDSGREVKLFIGIQYLMQFEKFELSSVDEIVDEINRYLKLETEPTALQIFRLHLRDQHRFESVELRIPIPEGPHQNFTRDEIFELFRTKIVRTKNRLLLSSNIAPQFYLDSKFESVDWRELKFDIEAVFDIKTSDETMRSWLDEDGSVRVGKIVTSIEDELAKLNRIVETKATEKPERSEARALEGKHFDQAYTLIKTGARISLPSEGLIYPAKDDFLAGRMDDAHIRMSKVLVELTDKKTRLEHDVKEKEKTQKADKLEHEYKLLDAINKAYGHVTVMVKALANLKKTSATNTSDQDKKTKKSDTSSPQAGQAAIATKQTKVEELNLHQLPEGFREAFEAANSKDAKEKVIKEFYKIESSIKFIYGEKEGVKVIKGFDPTPQEEQLYYLTAISKLIRVESFDSQEIHFEDALKGKKYILPISNFVPHVQRGIWVLESKFDLDDFLAGIENGEATSGRQTDIPAEKISEVSETPAVTANIIRTILDRNGKPVAHLLEERKGQITVPKRDAGGKFEATQPTIGLIYQALRRTSFLEIVQSDKTGNYLHGGMGFGFQDLDAAKVYFDENTKISGALIKRSEVRKQLDNYLGAQGRNLGTVSGLTQLAPQLYEVGLAPFASALPLMSVPNSGFAVPILNSPRIRVFVSNGKIVDLKSPNKRQTSFKGNFPTPKELLQALDLKKQDSEDSGIILGQDLSELKSLYQKTYDDQGIGVRVITEDELSNDSFDSLKSTPETQSFSREKITIKNLTPIRPAFIQPNNKVGYIVGPDMFKKYAPLFAFWQIHYGKEFRFKVVAPDDDEESEVIRAIAEELSREYKLPTDYWITVHESAEQAKTALMSKRFFNTEGYGLASDADLLKNVPGFKAKSDIEMNDIALQVGLMGLVAHFQEELKRIRATAKSA